MQAAKREFDRYFQNWNIELPEKELANRSPGFIAKAGWTIRYIFGRRMVVNMLSSMLCTG